MRLSCVHFVPPGPNFIEPHTRNTRSGGAAREASLCVRMCNNPLALVSPPPASQPAAATSTGDEGEWQDIRLGNFMIPCLAHRERGDFLLFKGFPDRETCDGIALLPLVGWGFFSLSIFVSALNIH